MPFRFVHTADIHLDSPLSSLALRDPELGELVGTATRDALSNIVDLCLAERVDALLIAGDLYDGSQTSMKTAGFLAAEFRRLTAAGIRVFLIRGNHDAMSRIPREAIRPAGVHIFDGHARPEVLPGAADGRDVVVHGVSFARPLAPESLLRKFAPPVPGAVNIAMLHTSLAGAEGHDVYAPVSSAELAGAGFDYWALGHVHVRRVVSDRPAIVMPGIPQGRDIGEAGAKSVTLVDLDGAGRAVIEARDVSRARFERLEVDISTAGDLDAVVSLAGAGFGDLCAGTGAREVILRLRLTGETPLAWRCRADRDILMETLRAEAPAHLWIEKLEIACTPPGPTPETDGATPVADLARIVTEEIAGSAAFRDQGRDLLEQLRKALPPDEAVRMAFGRDAAEADRLIDDLAAEGTADVLARLATSGGDET